MPILKGTATGSIIGIPYNIPSTIESVFLVNNTGAAITAILYVIEFDTNNKVAIISDTIAANNYVSSNIPIKLLAGFTAYLVVSGSCDYYLSITE